MSLGKQYFDNWLVFIKQQDRSFSRTEKNSNHSSYMKGFSITRSSNIFSIRSESYILAEIFWQQPTWKSFWMITLNLRLVKLGLRTLGYNNNSTQNQNLFQPTARNLLDISFVNIKFSNESIPYALRRIEPYNSKLLLIPTINGSLYYHTSWKTKSVL